jgi:hypothetical protein
VDPTGLLSASNGDVCHGWALYWWWWWSDGLTEGLYTESCAFKLVVLNSCTYGAGSIVVAAALRFLRRIQKKQPPTIPRAAMTPTPKPMPSVAPLLNPLSVAGLSGFEVPIATLPVVLLAMLFVDDVGVEVPDVADVVVDNGKETAAAMTVVLKISRSGMTRLLSFARGQHQPFICKGTDFTETVS